MLWEFCILLVFVFLFLPPCPLVLSGEAVITPINHRSSNKQRKKPSADVEKQPTFTPFDSFVDFSRESLGISAHRLSHLTFFSII